MRYLYLLLVFSYFSGCSDTHKVIYEINGTNLDAILDKKLLGNVETIMTTIEAALVLLLGVIGIIGYGHYKKREIIREVEDRMSLEIDKKFKNQTKEVYENISQKTTSIIKNESKKQRQESQKEEFLRNMLLNDLNRMRASEQQDNENIAQAFSDHVDRYHVVSQITSGIKEQQTKALRKLSTGVYKKIIKLKSFRDYIEFLKESDIDLDTLDKIVELDLKL